MSDQIESNENGDVDAESGMLSRRRALGLGAVVAGGVWVTPAILSFDAASAETSGARPTTTVMTEPPTTTTPAGPRTITASVTGSVPGVTNPAPVTVDVGQDIYLNFTTDDPAFKYEIFYETVDGTAEEYVDYDPRNGWLYVNLGYGAGDGEIHIPTIATGPGPNRSFTVSLVTHNTYPPD
jgi:hypothetical protein